ncbi:MAG: penicillin-binding protein [bacterium]
MASSGLVLFCFLLLFRLYNLQVLQKEFDPEAYKKQHTANVPIKRPRGNIYDRYGEELAVTIEVKSIYAANPGKVSFAKRHQLAARLAPILDKGLAEIENKLKKNTNVLLARKINPIKAESIRDIKLFHIDENDRTPYLYFDSQNKESYLYFDNEYQRFYPKRKLAAHLLGFVNVDNEGQEGIEGYFDSVLAGPSEYLNMPKDASGKPILIEGKDALPSSQGHSLVLTIDEVIQYAAEVELTAACQQHNAPGGSIIVMDPMTGEVLAMAIYPSFNPNSYSQYEQRRNIAITDPFEPGSTFKAITAAVVLKEGVVDESARVFCPGYIEIGSCRNCRIDCHRKHGELNFREAIEESCNVGVITAALRLNPEEFYTTARNFGFCTQTGIQLPAENSGKLNRPRNWSKTSLPTLAIGQGEISVTPLQLITAISVLANGGKLMRPLMVKKVIDAKGELIKEYSPEAVRQVIPPSLALQVTDILKGVVTQGTGEEAAIEGYSVAGKTGTAQKVDPQTGRYSKDKVISSFVGYLPADDPKIVMLVIIDEPQDIHWGSKVAAPVFKRVVERILPHLRLFPPQIMISNPPPPIIHPRQLKIEEDDTPIMADLTGLTMREVWRLFSPYELEMEFTGSGIAFRQFPLPDSPLYPGTLVSVSFKPPLN